MNELKSEEMRCPRLHDSRPKMGAKNDVRDNRRRGRKLEEGG